METRQITQVKIYKLVLNPMRGNIENASMVAIAYDKSRLVNWYEEQMATEAFSEVGSGSFECHGDSHQWNKTFKKGSYLEWYNPTGLGELNHYGHGIQEGWTTEEAIQNFMGNNYSGVQLVQ